ncbi:MAG: VWA domain-containing protein [Gammaproteobacteria bacterium]|nr:VWA domain-containing protein [Gammaproteobacteria bacterium]
MEQILAWRDVTFVWWWMFFILPLPLIVRFLMQPRQRGGRVALKVPFFASLAMSNNRGSSSPKRGGWTLLLLSLVWVFLVIAIARPVLAGKKIPMPVKGRDVMLAIDLSGSMDERDLTGGRYNRLDVVKAAADEFIARRKGDRLGLILFSTRAYLQAPLTFDRQVVRELLREAEVGLTGKKTAIGDAIAIALKRLSDRPEKAEKDSQVLVLLTDGANNAGVMKPMQAVALAKKLGVRIYTIGVGSRSRGFFGQGSSLDEVTLKAIASKTGAKYFRATDAKTLDNIYKEIDALVPTAAEPQYFSPQTSLFHYPAAVAFVFTGLLMLISLSAQLANIILSRKSS